MLKNKKILLVESNSVNRLLISSVLSESGAYVQIIASEEQLEEFNLGEEIDIAIIDLHFEGANGLSILKKMVVRKGGDFPVFGMTNSIEEIKVMQPNIDKLCTLLEKPFSIENFKQLINKNSLKVGLTHESLEEELFSLVKIEDMSRGNESFVQRMIGIFVDDIPKSMDKILLAMENKDYSIIKAGIHRIKPSLKMMCINSIESDVEKLEYNCEQMVSLEDVPFLVSKINNVLIRVVESMKK